MPLPPANPFEKEHKEYRRRSRWDRLRRRPALLISAVALVVVGVALIRLVRH